MGTEAAHTLHRRTARPFSYLADPLCVGALLVYAANRWLFKPYGISGEFGRTYLNDVLCLPLFLPMILCAQRSLGVRRHDAPPRLWEVLQHWVIFSVVFELVLPCYPKWFASTADPLDVLAYLAGGIGGWLWWSRAAPALSGRTRPSIMRVEEAAAVQC